jgi:SAM-dependent methyltransferase
MQPPEPPDSRGGRAAAHWDDAYEGFASAEQRSATYALASPLYQREYIDPHFGPETPSWVEGLRRALGLERPFEHALVLGCGLGDGLLHLLDEGLVRRLHGIDISATAIESARASAARAGLEERVRFEMGDFHGCPLAEGDFDLVLMVMSLHHALDLDAVLSRVRQALRPGGLFVVNEYIGPSRWQFTRAQLVLANALLAILPESRRRRSDGTLKERVTRPSVEEMIAMDPSEAAHSEEIPARFEQHFELVHRVDYGGAVAQLVLDEIIGNFSAADRASMRWFRLVTAVDRFARLTGLVPSANAFLVGR